MAASTTLKKIFYLFLFSSIYIASCAAAMAFQTAYLFRLPHNYNFYGFVFCGTVCSYNLHWGLTPKSIESPIAPEKGLDHIPVPVHFMLAGAALVGAFIFLILLWPHWFWLAGAAALSFLYTAPKIPFRITRFLQKIAFGKTIFLTLSWTYITAVLPLLITDTPIHAQHIIFCVNRFYLIYAICILFDLRDRESDQKEGIKGMITQFDLLAVDLVYWGSMAVYFATSIALVFYFPMPVVLAFLIPGLILAVGYSWFKKQETEFVYNFLLDGLMIFSLPLLLLFGI